MSPTALAAAVPFPLDVAVAALPIGAGATLLMDLWLVLLRRAGLPTLDFAMLGRWAGHAARGRVVHASMARAAPVTGERALGWIVHYAVGIAFAAVLIAIAGPGWLEQPQWWPALLFGLLTVAAPLLLMQPAMGAGFFARRTPTPLANSLRSLANHAVFGSGLYAAALAWGWLVR